MTLRKRSCPAVSQICKAEDRGQPHPAGTHGTQRAHSHSTTPQSFLSGLLLAAAQGLLYLRVTSSQLQGGF